MKDHVIWLVCIRIDVLTYCLVDSRCVFPLIRQTRWLNFASLLHFSHSFWRRGVMLIWFPGFCSINSSTFACLEVFFVNSRPFLAHNFLVTQVCLVILETVYYSRAVLLFHQTRMKTHVCLDPLLNWDWISVLENVNWVITCSALRSMTYAHITRNAHLNKRVLLCY